jgi:phosphomannomutase
MKIIVDAGNGAGGFFAEDVLAPLGADTAGSQFLEPDGRFPNHIPNPENEEAMRSVSDAVLASGAHLGIIFDTDVDRASVVDSSGEPISRNRLIALMSAIVLKEERGGTIVTDSITSTGLTKFILKRGGVHRRFKRGYRNVINEAQRLNKAGHSSPLAIETSGHGALRDNYFLDDGAYMITKILIEAAWLHREGKPLSTLLEGLEEPLESREFRLKIMEHDFRPAGEKILHALTSFVKHQPGWSAAPDNFEGVRCEIAPEQGGGWFLLRMSLHDPLMPLNIESNVQGGLVRIAKDLIGFLEKWPLDTSGMKAFLDAENV